MCINCVGFPYKLANGLDEKVGNIEEEMQWKKRGQSEMQGQMAPELNTILSCFQQSSLGSFSITNSIAQTL